jgi:glycosyltransferase involved in cell wall biosynthesis
MKRLAIFTSHPIQYQAPWFRALAQRPELKPHVFFSYIPSEMEQGVGFGQGFKWDIPLTNGYEWSVLSHRRLPAPTPAYLRKVATGVRSAIAKFQPDVALILGWHHVSLLQAMFACKSARVPIVLRGESNALRKRPWYVHAVHRAVMRQCAGFLAIGEANARFYADAGVPVEKILVAPYFVENDRFLAQAERLRGNRAQIRAEWSIPDAATCFAFVGKLEPKKRVMDYIDAIKLARKVSSGVHGLIVGTGEMLAEAKSRVGSEQIPISFAGFLNQSQITSAYVASDALILPSDFGETWGLVVNEAMATGLPALVSDRVGCAHDLVRQEQTGNVFPFGNVSRLADLIALYAADHSLRKTLGQQAQRLVLDEFSIERAVESTLEAARRFGSTGDDRLSC